MDELGGVIMIQRRTMMNDEIVNKSGNIAQLEKCKGSYLNGLQLFGKSKQFKTNGLQLYNGSTITLAPSNSSTGFTYATEYLLDVIKKLPAGVYSVSYTLKETGDLGTGVGKITLQDSLNNMLVNALNTFELTDDIKNKVEKVALYGRVKFSSTVFNFMLNAGNKPKPYEPYTGGIPSPNLDYPQNVNSGNAGEINVSVLGKNILHPEVDSNTKIFLPKGTQLSVSTENNQSSLGGSILLKSKNGSKIWLGINKGDTQKSIVLKEDAMEINNKLVAGVNHALFIGNIQDYEPYKPVQTLTLDVQGGLCGIPVSKNGNYTDEKGQQWVCNEIDCDRRKYIQRLAYEIVDKSTLNIVALSENTFRFAVCKTKNSYKMSDAMSNFAPFFIWANSKRSFAINGNQLYYGHTEVTTAEEIKQKFEALQKIEILGQLAEPVEHDLTAEEIEQYKALHTYTGTTVLSNDAEVYMKATYRKFK